MIVKSDDDGLCIFHLYSHLSSKRSATHVLMPPGLDQRVTSKTSLYLLSLGQGAFPTGMFHMSYELSGEPRGC
jgi:hypothetical protein